MIRVYDFTCPKGHTHERFVKDDMTVSLCPTCDYPAQRELSAPRFSLEGTTGSFPGAAAKWEQKRLQKQAIQQRQERDHGDRGWTD